MLLIPKTDHYPLSLIQPSNKGPWIAGGAVLKWFNKRSAGIGDIDVFFTDQAQFNKTNSMFCKQPTKSLLLPWIPPPQVELFQDEPFIILENRSTKVESKQVFNSKNAITYELTKTEDGVSQTWIVQLIRNKFYPDCQDVIDNFDISVCQLATDGKNLIAGNGTIKDINDKRLRVVNSRPGGMARVAKYRIYGYKPEKNHLLDIMQLGEDFCNVTGDEYDHF